MRKYVTSFLPTNPLNPGVYLMLTEHLHPVLPHFSGSIVPSQAGQGHLFGALSGLFRQLLCPFFFFFLIWLFLSIYSFPWWLSGKESTWQCRRQGFDPWVGKIPWRRAWQPTPVFLPGKSHGERSLVGYSPWGRRESDTT